MLEIASGPIHIFLDFNAVIVNLTSLSQEKQQECLNRIESNVKILKAYLEAGDTGDGHGRFAAAVYSCGGD